MKKLLSLLLCACTCLSLVSCAPKEESGEKSGGSGSNGESKTLDVWLQKSFSEEANSLLQERFEEFGTKNNVEVNVEIYSSSNIKQKFSAAVEAKELPDIYMTQQVSSFPFLDADIFEDMSGLISTVEKNSGEFVIKDLCYLDDKAFMIPFYNSVQMMFYRKDLLKEAGYDAPPTTWDELRTIAKDVTEKTGVSGCGIGCGVNDEDGEGTLNYILWGNGGGLYQDGKLTAVGNEKLKETLNFYTELYNVDKSIPQSAITWDASGNNTAYMAGQVAMVFNTTTVVNALKKDGMEELRANTGVAPIPAGTEGRFLPSSNVGFAVCKTGNSDVAFSALEMIYDETWYRQYIDMVAPVCAPALKNCMDTETWSEGDNKIIADCVQYKTHYWSEPDYSLTALRVGTDVYNQKLLCQTLQKILANNVSVDDALEELQGEFDQITEKY